MNCSEFKQLIPERTSGELAPERKPEMEAHELSCPACRQALEDWRQMESLLRSSWPTENPGRSFFLPAPPQRRGWLDTARTWFGLASMASVTVCFLVLVFLRPAIHFDHGQLSVNFTQGRSELVLSTPRPVSQAQVQAWVQEALAQAAVRTTESTPTASTPKSVATTDEQAHRVAQLAVQIELLKENQLSLWQQVQEHGVFLQSAWQPPSEQMDSNPKGPGSRP